MESPFEFKERVNPLLFLINNRLFEALLVQVFELDPSKVKIPYLVLVVSVFIFEW